MQPALIVKTAGNNPRDLLYVVLKDGEEIATALLGGHFLVGRTAVSYRTRRK